MVFTKDHLLQVMGCNFIKMRSRPMRFSVNRSRLPEVILGKDFLTICSKFTGEHPCQSVISIKLLCNFIKTTLQHGCSPVYLLCIFKTPFPKNTSGGLLLCKSANIFKTSLLQSISEAYSGSYQAFMIEPFSENSCR